MLVYGDCYDVLPTEICYSITTFLTWLEANGNLSEGVLARLLGRGFKKVCVFLYYSSSEFESNLLFTEMG